MQQRTYTEKQVHAWRRGGEAKSSKKTRACRENGKKGGRPRSLLLVCTGDPDDWIVWYRGVGKNLEEQPRLVKPPGMGGVVAELFGVEYAAAELPGWGNPGAWRVHEVRKGKNPLHPSKRYKVVDSRSIYEVEKERLFEKHGFHTMEEYEDACREGRGGKIKARRMAKRHDCGVWGSAEKFASPQTIGLETDIALRHWEASANRLAAAYGVRIPWEEKRDFFLQSCRDFAVEVVFETLRFVGRKADAAELLAAWKADETPDSVLPYFDMGREAAKRGGCVAVEVAYEPAEEDCVVMLDLETFQAEANRLAGVWGVRIPWEEKWDLFTGSCREYPVDVVIESLKMAGRALEAKALERRWLEDEMPVSVERYMEKEVRPAFR